MITVSQLCKRYPGSPANAVDSVSLAVDRGEFVSICGKSGSGKSTLLHMMAALVRADSGSIRYQDVEVTSLDDAGRTRLRKDHFAVVFQQHHLIPYFSALENTLLPFMDSLKPVRGEQMDRGREMLARVGLDRRQDARPGQLSGGEQQRVAIARALAAGARILFADEPTGSLDSATGSSIMDLLGELNSEGLTVVMVTHNPDYAALCGRCLHMADGRLLH